MKYRDYIRYSSKVILTTRYSNTYLGVLWWFIDPILLMCIYSFVYLVIFNIQTANYVVFILTGLIIWRWISNSITQSSAAISSKIGILEQVAVPKQVFPLVTLIVETMLFSMAFLLVVVAMGVDGVMPTIHLIELLPLIAATFIWLFGVSLVVSHYGAFIADLKPAISYGMRFIFYLSPVFYEVSRLPASIQDLYMLNPVAIILESFRNVVMRGTSPDYIGLLIIAGMGVLFIWIGLHLIQKHDKDYGRLK